MKAVPAMHRAMLRSLASSSQMLSTGIPKYSHKEKKLDVSSKTQIANLQAKNMHKPECCRAYRGLDICLNGSKTVLFL